MMKDAVAVVATVMFSLFLIAFPVVTFCNTFFIWVNDDRATVGFWMLVAMCIAYPVGGYYFWRTRDDVDTEEDIHA